MEDSSEFLKMAGSILLFVVALSVVIPLFSLARQTCDALIAYSDRESEFYNGYAYLDGTKGEDEYFYNGVESSDPTKKVRKVGLDTIIPSIYRSYDENYRIIFMKSVQPVTGTPGDTEFFGKLEPFYFYKRIDENGNYIDSNVFDLNGFSIPKENVNEFIEAFLYGKFKKYAGYGTSPQTGFQAYYHIKFDDGLNIINNSSSIAYNRGKGLYDVLINHLTNNKSIYEYLGIYYLEDLEKIEKAYDPVTGGFPGIPSGDEDKNKDDNVPESMKDEKRVITYVLENY